MRLKKILLSLMLLFSVSAIAGSKEKAPIQTISLDAAIQKLSNSYTLAINQLSGEIDIEEVSVTFKIAATKKVGGAVKILVFKVGGERSSSTESSITYNFSKPKSEKMSLISFDLDDDQLATTIVAAAKEFIGINKLPGSLIKDNFEIEQVFGITKNATGGLEFTVFNIETGIEGNYERLAEHTIHIKFSLKK